MWDPTRPDQTMKCAGWAIPQLSGQTERDSLGEMKGCRRRKIKITTVVEYGETEKDHQLDDDQLSPLCKGLSHAPFSKRFRTSDFQVASRSFLSSSDSES